jgi:hypothetical protein
VHQLRLFGRLLSGATGANLVPKLCRQHAALHRSSQRSQQKRVPVQGRCDFCHESAVGLHVLCICLNWFQRAPPTAGYHNSRLEAGEVCCSRHQSFSCAVSDEDTACFRVCRNVRNVRGGKRLCRLLRPRPHALCLPCALCGVGHVLVNRSSRRFMSWPVEPSLSGFR